MGRKIKKAEEERAQISPVSPLSNSGMLEISFH
jgi:hypothetical protein